MLRLSISAWDKKEYDQERRLKKALKDLAILKITCVNGKFLELQYIRTQVQNITDDSSFQNFKFNYVERAKITICNNAVIWTDKVIGCVKSRFEDGSHKDILQAACKALNSWTVMEETPKENRQDSDARRGMSKKMVTMAMTSKVMMSTSKVMMKTASIVTITTRMT